MSIRKLIISVDNSNNILDELYDNIRKMGGVSYVKIFKQSGMIKILYDDAAVRNDKILNRISSFGININNFFDIELPKKEEIIKYSYLRIEKVFALLVSIIVFFLSEKFNINKYVSFILYFGLVLWLSSEIRYELKKSLKIFNIYFVSLVYFFSFFFYKLFFLIFPNFFRVELINWYEASMLVFVVYVGFGISKYLVSKFDIDFRMFLPKFFKVKISSSIEKKDLRDVKVDEIVLYEKGDLVGCDGVIVSGNCVVDESLIKGNEILERKSYGEKIFSGSFISDGIVEVKVLKKPESSLIFSIIKNSLLKEKEGVNLSSIPFAIYERYLVFLPVVFITFVFLSLKGLTGFLWLESIFVSFFITYPYLIWLIFPVSYIFLLSSGVKRGFSIKNTDSIRILVKADTLFFLSDKYIDYKTLSSLKREGFKLILLSNKDFVDEKLKEFFNECYFNVDFEEKEGFILRKKIEGKKIIGIGDCVYDLDSLSECDVSIIVAVHPELSMLPCDVIFLKRDSYLVYELISYSRFIVNVIKKNSFIVLFFHLFFLPTIVLYLAFLDKKILIENIIIFTSFIVILLIFINSIRIYSYSKN